jgi:uncharacterized protein
MRKDEALAKLKAHTDALRQRGVEHLYLFGSVSRDEAGAESDLDLFFDPERSDFSLLDVISIQHYLSDHLGINADIMTRGSLHPYLKDRIQSSAIEVF